MIIFTHIITPRLRWLASFLEEQLVPEKVELTDNRNTYLHDTGVRINYSPEKITATEWWMRPQGLLHETDIHPLDPVVTQWENNPVFFETEGDFPFDFFALSFYLLSRYEEYLPYQPDSYGRFAHDSSHAFRNHYLQKPLVNLWLGVFKDSLQQKFPEAKFKEPAYSFKPTYDIDEAWSYRHKTWNRSAGGALKDLLSGRFADYIRRRKVLNKKEEDPYDSFSWMDDLHRPSAVKPVYFFLVPEKNGRYDKNNLLSETAMQTLIRQHAEKYTIGLHPSWQSGDDTSLLLQEKDRLEKISGTKITSSRQHYIRMRLPQTYQLLEAAGIRDEYSMGYGSVNGFRASFASPYRWYDLQKETVTNLTVHPFSFMDANSFYEQKQNAQQTEMELKAMEAMLQKINAPFCTIWHNTFLGTEPRFAGWREIWQRFYQSYY